MFENIYFFNYETPQGITTEILRKMPATPTDIPEEFLIESNNNPHLLEEDNFNNTEYFFSGKLDIFMRPPVQKEVYNIPYYMESFSIFTCMEGSFTRRKDYASYLILYTYEGQGRLEYAGKTWNLYPGDGFFIDCRQPHYYCTEGSHWKHSVLHFNGPLLETLYQQHFQTNSAAFSLPFSGHYQKNLELLLHIYSTPSTLRDWQASDCLSHMLTELLSTPQNTSASRSSFTENLQYLVTYMENHFSADLTLDFLAEFSGISKYYLSREFKKHTGYSPIDYLILLRIEHTKTLLVSTDMPANKVAHTVGIHDMNNFTSLFKKKTGMTPGEFRKR